MTILQKLILKNAIVATLLIAGFFLISKASGLAEYPAFRFLNILFLTFGIYSAIKTNITLHNESNYLANFGVGMQTALLTVALSLVGFVIYVKFVNPNYGQLINSSVLIGNNLNLFEIIFTLAIEGLASTIIGTFTVMQYYKNYVFSRSLSD